MHEMGIANAVLEAVRVEIARYPGSHPSKVGVRIGELAAVDPSALHFCFEALVRETDLESLELEIQACPRRHRCFACGAEFNVKDYDFQCPCCGGVRTECISGDELELAYLEVEEHEPSTP
ncbi:MAG TPA: hydrogenase maturation nickel metallochaperone HypA [Terriglobales bacterium]|jgi:hydrogenase nickel incorporation protein HypA/HybF